MTDIEYLKKYYEGNINDAIKRLENGEPVQYIVGNVDFYDTNILVDKRVLIPRFETEELVYKTVEKIKNKNYHKALDIGTGSGCIDISLKKHTNFDITAIDISADALALAKENALRNNQSINFIESDIYSNVKEKYDLIISNPPYIRYDEEIDEIVKNNEPHLALYSSNNGLNHYDMILKDAKKYLNEHYLIAFEIGYLQGEDIKNMAQKYLDDDISVSIEKDMQGKDRFVFIES